MKEYPFLNPCEKTGYRMFPDELENDDDVFYHGTSEANRQPILEGGFKIIGKLPSVSFAKSKVLALDYACKKRSDTSPKGCVFAVRFEREENPAVVRDAVGIHLYREDRQPDIVGYCVVPATFVLT